MSTQAHRVRMGLSARRTLYYESVEIGTFLSIERL